MTRAGLIFMAAWVIITGALIYTLMLACEVIETLRAVGRLLFCW